MNDTNNDAMMNGTEEEMKKKAEMEAEAAKMAESGSEEAAPSDDAAM